MGGKSHIYTKTPDFDETRKVPDSINRLKILRNYKNETR